MIKLRLKQLGRKGQQSFRIVAIQDSVKRDGRPLEELGFYNPRTKVGVVQHNKVLGWLKRGAQPTVTVRNILLTFQTYGGALRTPNTRDKRGGRSTLQ
jgi:small subunit ribosomal protein S16